MTSRRMKTPLNYKFRGREVNHMKDQYPYLFTTWGVIGIASICGIISLLIGLWGGAAIERKGTVIEQKVIDNRTAARILKEGRNNRPVQIGESRFTCQPFVVVK